MAEHDPITRVAPELRDVLAAFPAADYDNWPLQERRESMKTMERPPLAPELQVVRREERHVPDLNGAPDVRVLVYTPPSTAASARPAILHVHGGGYVIGDPNMNDAMNRQMSLAADCVIVSVDYRLAPETTFPGALEDCYAALIWLRDHAAELGVDTTRIAVAGESAGGGHAAALATHARDQGGPAVSFMLLDSPMIDDRTCADPDPHPHCGHFVWTPQANRFGWKSMLGVEPGGADVPANGSPARAEDLRGMPATFISVGALDLFLEESLEYIRRLARAGVDVELHVIPGAYHGYSMAQGSPQGALNTELRLAAIKRAFAR